MDGYAHAAEPKVHGSDVQKGKWKDMADPKLKLLALISIMLLIHNYLYGDPYNPAIHDCKQWELRWSFIDEPSNETGLMYCENKICTLMPFINKTCVQWRRRL